MSVDRLVSVVAELENFWKKIKEKYNLTNIECSLILRLEKDQITLK